jgi:integrase
MSLYKREDSTVWWVRFTHKGKRVQQSSGTPVREKAEEFEAKLKSSMWEQERLGAKPIYKWNDAVVRYLGETKHKASQISDIYHLRWLDQHLNGIEMQAIKRDLLDKISATKLAEGVENSTVNRVMEVIRAILRKACNDWEWLDRVPAVRMLQEPTKRVRWITRDEADKLIAELPPHLADMARFSLETGLRRSNVTGLQWSQVDLVRMTAWIHPDQAKARKAIPVPLSDVAVALLRKQIGKHLTNVFTFNGKPVYQVNTKAWQKALKRADIEDFRWHDLRHTWASWHIQEGTPMHVLQELGGWSTPEMVQKYAHLSSEHLAKWVDRKLVDVVEGLPESGTFFTTVEEKGLSISA